MKLPSPRFIRPRWLLSLLPCVALCGTLAAGEYRPFPQHTVYTAGTIKPSAKSQAVLDAETLKFYKVWKKRYLRTAAPGQLYVFANAEGTFESPNVRSVSEGQGYGMIATVLMAGADPDAHAAFDALYRFFRAHPTENHADLMAWRQVSRPSGEGLTEGPDDRDSATDGDMDIGYSLLLADRQWGSKGDIDYKAEGLKVIAAVRSGEANLARHTLALGNWVDAGNSHYGSLRSSDFMPGHLKAYAQASGDPCWGEILRNTYQLLNNMVAAFSPQTGLLPDFIVQSHGKFVPAPRKFLEGANDGRYAYNACRVPWRIGTDYLISGDPDARALLKPLNAWIRDVTKGDPGRINAGYTLEGHPLAEDDSAAFVGPFAVAAMVDASQQVWLDALWSDLIKRDPDRERYYGNSVKLMTMIVISGNWW